jgi:hypothetical protein
MKRRVLTICAFQGASSCGVDGGASGAGRQPPLNWAATEPPVPIEIGTPTSHNLRFDDAPSNTVGNSDPTVFG